jgi:NADH-quinone oxidoreductase subunit M
MVFFGSYVAVLPMLGPGFAIIAIYGTVLTAIFQLRAIKHVFYGVMPARYQPAAASGEIPASPGMTDVSTLAENAPYILLIVASLIIGFMPFLLIHIVEPSVSLLPFMPSPR